MSFRPRLDAWYLTGPTASGKSAIGLQLAEQIGAEIISLDSMALYRGLDIGTAKPSVVDRRRAPHHLIDLLDPADEFSIAQYVDAAHRAIDEIHARGRVALFVGGTPLYLKALLRGLFTGPAPDWPLRKRLAQLAHEHGGDFLHQKLAAVDTQAAARLHANDTRRLIRAIEVYEKTGKTITEHQRQFAQAHAAEECRVFVVDWPRDALYARIDRRVDEMFAAGWVDEVRTLQSVVPPFGRTARQAVGYGEIIRHLAGEIDLAATIDLVKTRTRQFAKRQLTWFRSLSECRPIAVRPDERPDATAGRIVAIANTERVCGG